MTVDNVTLTALTTLIMETSTEIFKETINRRTALLNSGAIKSWDTKGKEWVEQLMVGGNPSVTFVGDRGTRPTGESNLPREVKILPKSLTAVMTMGSRAALANMGATKAANLFSVNVKQTATAMQAHLNRALMSRQLGSPVTLDGNALTAWTSGAANGTATFSFTDVSGFRPNMAVDLHDVAGTARVYTVRVTDVTPGAVTPNGGSLSTANVAGTVSFINDIVNPATGSVATIADTTTTTSDVFYLRGTTQGFASSTVSLNTTITGLSDFLGSNNTGDYLGFTSTTLPGWRGGDENIAGAYTQEACLQFMSRRLVASGQPVTHIIMNRPLALVHAFVSETKAATFGLGTAAVNSARPKPLGSKYDKFGDIKAGDVDGAISIAGVTPVIDEWCPHAQAYFVNSDCLKLGTWEDIEPETEAGSPLMVSRSALDVSIFYTGTMDLATNCRSAHGILRGITGL